jgi:hypothetical protein
LQRAGEIALSAGNQDVERSVFGHAAV